MKKKYTGVPIDQMFIEIVINLHVIFNDTKKVVAWLKTKNMNFGNYSPLYLLSIGRGKKVLQFIEAALDDNSRELT